MFSRVICAAYAVFVNTLFVVGDDGTICDRRPLGSISEPLPADNRYLIEVEGVIDDKYIPNYKYVLRLRAQDNVSTFIGFTISAREDSKPNERNPRRPIALMPGVILPKPERGDAKISPICNNTVIQSNVTPKNSVEVFWIAPPKENKCVTLYALVAVKPDVWYNYEGPLSRRICEDSRKADDMQPMVNDNCEVCEEARYQLTFEGLWSYNTHPSMYPTSQNMARFSDVVGASHENGFVVWKFNGDASKGLKMLAEQGNTTELELEIQQGLGETVRTIIKATAPPKPNMSSTAIFRASPKHHLVSLVTALEPSPDWFLGVANFELCSADAGTWADSLKLNLYPLDAGTDSGVFFESPNDETLPSQPISSAIISASVSKDDIKPFARITFELIRTYAIPNCEANANPEDGGTVDSKDENTRGFEDNFIDDSYGKNRAPPYFTTSSEASPLPDPESSADCPVTEWESWLSCEGTCQDGLLKGIRSRLRYHIVNGKPVGIYTENGSNDEVEVPEKCMETVDVSQVEPCEEPCKAEVTVTAEEQSSPIQPGQGWSWKP